MNRKAKGTNAERDLIHAFHKHQWSAIRVAGSGSSRYPSPDILAGNALRKLAIECKTVNNNAVYIPKSEVEQLRIFAQNFGAEPWIAVKLEKEEWVFLTLEDLKETEASFSVSVGLGKMKGLLFEEVIGIN